jgi:hypothetical protein
MKRDNREILEAFAALLAFIAITALVAFAATNLLEAIGIATQIQVVPYIDNQGYRVASALTSPGYSSILFGVSVAVLLILAWFSQKPKGISFAYVYALGGLVMSWAGLTSFGALLDFVFGYEDGLHQIIATIIWLALCALWAWTVYVVIRRFHRLTEDTESKS